MTEVHKYRVLVLVRIRKVIINTGFALAVSDLKTLVHSASKRHYNGGKPGKVSGVFSCAASETDHFLLLLLFLLMSTVRFVRRFHRLVVSFYFWNTYVPFSKVREKYGR